MSDYISRADAKRLLADIRLGEAPMGQKSVYQSGIEEGLNMAYGAIDTMRPADVRPVVRGEWINEDVDFVCSVCGHDAYTEGDYRQVRTDFCPNCGADMRPAEKEANDD